MSTRGTPALRANADVFVTRRVGVGVGVVVVVVVVVVSVFPPSVFGESDPTVNVAPRASPIMDKSTTLAHNLLGFAILDEQVRSMRL
jgi:hypothetical protein